MKAVSTPVQLSARASKEVRKILSTQAIPEGYGLRVGVRGGGCSGMSYILGFDKHREHDLTFDTEGIVLYIDKRQGLYLMGTTIDYHEGLDSRGFIFDNPNAHERVAVDPASRPETRTDLMDANFRIVFAM